MNNRVEINRRAKTVESSGYVDTGGQREQLCIYITIYIVAKLNYRGVCMCIPDSIESFSNYPIGMRLEKNRRGSGGVKTPMNGQLAENNEKDLQIGNEPLTFAIQDEEELRVRTGNKWVAQKSTQTIPELHNARVIYFRFMSDGNLLVHTERRAKAMRPEYRRVK